MNDEQERLLRLTADGNWHKAGPGFNPIMTLAQVVLELSRMAHDHWKVAGEPYVRYPNGREEAMRERVDRHQVAADSGRDGTMFDRLVACVEESPIFWGLSVARNAMARALVLDLLSILDADPGPRVSSAPESGTFRKIIQAIRRGE